MTKFDPHLFFNPMWKEISTHLPFLSTPHLQKISTPTSILTIRSLGVRSASPKPGHRAYFKGFQVVGHIEGEKSCYRLGSLGERRKLPSGVWGNRRNFEHFMP